MIHVCQSDAHLTVDMKVFDLKTPSAVKTTGCQTSKLHDALRGNIGY